MYYNRGYSYSEKGDHDKAIADYTVAIRINPKGGYTFYAQGNSHIQRVSRRLLAIIWASPYTLLGLFLGGIGLCTGGRVRIRGGAVEFYGGAVKWLLRRFPNGQFTLAFTLGHTILGQTDASLDICRDHEMVHVRQFDRWGPLMGPAYLGCSLVLWLMRRRPYRDNPFEREPYRQEGGE